jgi:hypothetical protein
MREDPIVAEIHRIRQQIMIDFDHDLGAYMQYLKAMEEEERKRGRVIIDVPFRHQPRGKPDAA